LADVGYEQLTIEAIAERAGVGKQTIYRRWPSKAAVVAEAALSVDLVGEPLLPAHTTDLASDMRAWLRQRQNWLESPGVMALVRGLVAAAADRSVDAARLYDHLTQPQRQVLLERLELAREEGHVRGDADLAAVAEALLGVVLYRILARGPETPRGGDGVVEALLHGVAVCTPAHRRPGSPAEQPAPHGAASD